MSAKHKGFWMNVDGKPVHLRADPNMTPETKAALEALIRSVQKMPNPNYTEGDNLRVCEICEQYECVAPATKCWRCREQEMIDNA